MPDKRSLQTYQSVSYLPQQTRYTWHDLERSTGGHRQGDEPPVCRSKHASCVVGGFVYIHGGRNGGMSHRDMWRYELATGGWEKLVCRGEQPMSPQEHTMVTYKRKLYVFGGQFSCAMDNEPPLWILDLDLLSWRKQRLVSEVLTPGGRRGHTAVVFDDKMCVYGGYVDLKGSSNEVWIFDLQGETWHLVNTSTVTDFGPDGRHGHSAVMYEGAMWVYGGMSDLQHRDDLWRWDFICNQWNRIKVRPSPPPLRGHSATVVAGQMLVFGGATQGGLSNTLWCFHFESRTWTKLVPCGPSPPTCVHHCCGLTTIAVTNGNRNHDNNQRSQSVPHLKQQLSVALDDRPRSSPPKLPAEKQPEQPSSFRNNKVVPAPPEVEMPTLVQEYSPIKSAVNWWRSTSVVSSQSSATDDVPLLELRRSASMDSATSSEYMDTVAGCYVNRLITNGNGGAAYQRLASCSPEPTNRTAQNQRMHRAKTPLSLSPELSGAHKRHKSMEREVEPGTDDLQLEDLEDYSAETDPLISRATQQSSISCISGRPQGCFVRKYSHLCESCDSLPYGQSAAAAASSLATEIVDAETSGDMEMADMGNGQTSSAAVLNGTTVSQQQTTADNHSRKEAPPSYDSVVIHEDHFGPCPPRYESSDFLAGDSTPGDNMKPSTTALIKSSSSGFAKPSGTVASQKNGGKGSIPQAWAGDMDVNCNLANSGSVRGATGGTDGYDQGMDRDTRPQPYSVYIVGGQTTESTRYDIKPLLMFSLHVQPGIR